jgi:gas vesicle protein
MGFLTGVITGVAVAAGAAAWYMSRSGANVREQYRIEARLGELGDQLEARTRDIQTTVNAQLAELRSKGDTALDEATAAVGSDGHDAEGTLDDAAASAAEAAAEVAAEADAITARVKRTAKDVAGNGAG